jgi:hypothetical protein
MTDYQNEIDSESEIEEILEVELNELVRRVIPTERLDNNEVTLFAQELYALDDLGLNNFDKIDESMNRISKGVYELISKFFDAGLLTGEIDAQRSEKYKYVFGRIVGVTHYLGRTLKTGLMSKNLLNPDYDYSQDVDPSCMERVNVFDFNKTTNYQQLLFGIKHRITEKNYRKSGDKCMRLKRTEDGYNTRYWMEVEPIKEFCNRIADASNNFKLWKCATHPPGNLNTAITRLTDSNEGFKDVVKDRHIFSYRNGIYVTNWVNPETEIMTGKWYPYLSAVKGIEIGAIEENRVACKYFDAHFEDYTHINDWYDIPTPHFQSILDYQEFSPEVCRWLYTLAIGRFLYEVGECDDWQVLVYLLGKAKTGKSTICAGVCKGIFDAEDVGTLSNNGEKKFGLSALYNKLAFVAPEVKENCSLEQSEFQSMISGEVVSIAEKFKTAFSVKWTTPSVWAGNQVPNYSDNSGSISRRLVVFEFVKTVVHANTQLGKLLRAEIPLLVQKGNMAYLEAIRDHGTKDLWDGVLPEYFSRTSANVQEQSNSLVAFMNSPHVIEDPEASTDHDSLIDAFNNFCRLNNMPKVRWNKPFYDTVFEKRHIKEELRDGGRFYKGIKLPVIAEDSHTASVGPILEDDGLDD